MPSELALQQIFRDGPRHQPLSGAALAAAHDGRSRGRNPANGREDLLQLRAPHEHALKRFLVHLLLQCTDGTLFTLCKGSRD